MDSGLTDLLSHLNRLTGKMEQAIEGKFATRGFREESSVAIAETLKLLKELLKRLDPMVRHVVRGDARLVAAWEQAVRVEQSTGSTSTPSGPGSLTDPQSSVTGSHSVPSRCASTLTH